MTPDAFALPDLNTTLAFAVPQWAVGLLVVGFLFISVVMILIVLIQRPQGGGLSGAFGAGSGSAGQTAFGARTGDALTISTITIFVLYLLAAIFLNYTIAPPSAENPSITAAADSTPAGEVDPDQTFTELPAVIVGGEDEGAGAETAGPLPEAGDDTTGDDTSSDDQGADPGSGEGDAQDEPSEG